MKKFYTLFILLCSLFLTENVLGAKVFNITSESSFSGSGIYCQGAIANKLTAVFNTCNSGGGFNTATNVTITWYSNTTNSTTIAGATIQSGPTVVSTGTSGTNLVTYTFTPSTAAIGTLYYFAVLSSPTSTVCGFTSTLTTSAAMEVVVTTAMTYGSSAVSQYSPMNSPLNCTDVTNPILVFTVSVTGGCTPDSITQFNFTTAGSTNAGDITKARLYYTHQTAGYNAFYFFGSVNNPSGAFTINGAQALLDGSGTYYFYLCYDISSAAPSADVVDATLSSFVFSGVTENNMSPNPTCTGTVGSGTCSKTPDLAGQTSNIQTISAGSYIIPMDNSHQDLWMGRPFNTKAYGLVRALLMQDIPVKWVIKTGKTKDSSDFVASVSRVYPTVTGTTNEYFKSGEFIVDPAYLNTSVYPGEKTAIQVMSAFATEWDVAVYQLNTAVTADVRYTLSHRPKIALFNNGGFQAVQLAMLDSAKVWTTGTDTALSAGAFDGLASCFTFCSEAHWSTGSQSADSATMAPVWQFVEEGGNFLAQCAGIEKYENEMQINRHFQSSRGVTDQNVTKANTYHNPDMAFSQFQGTITSRSGTVASFELPTTVIAHPSLWRPEMYKCVSFSNTSGTTDTIVASSIHLNNPDSTGGNVFYLAGHDYQTNTTNADEIAVLNWINGARMYLNATFVPANRPTPTPLQAGSNVTICQGSSTTLGGSPTGPASGVGTTYTWSPSTGLNNSNSANPIATPTVTTTYTVFVSSSGCSYLPASVVVTVIPTPATPTTGGNTPVCVGSALNLTASTVTGATYSWTGPNSFTSSSQNPSIASVTTAAAGTYSVIATISGCPGSAGTVTIAVNITPTVSVSGPVTICSGNSTTLTASGATTYSWSPNTNLSATTGASVTASPTSTTTYTVTGTSGSCTSSAQTVVVTVNTTPTVTLSAPPTICSGNSTTLTASGATTYSWSPNTNLSATTGASVNATPTSTITYSVTGTTGGCTSTPTTVVVTVNTTPTVSLSAPPTICSGNSTTLTASGATTYSWSPNTNLSATTGASVNANPASTITYSVTGTTTGCPSVPATVVVTVNTTPTVTLSAPPTICSGNSTTLTASGATTYSWSPNTNLSATTGASVNASPNSTITYSVTGTTTGCPSVPATVVVTVNATPTVTLSAPPTICSGNSTTLTASGATTYTWSPNTNLSATTGASVNASPTSTATYTVIGTTGGCTSTPTTVVVTVNTTPTVTLSAPPTICSGNSTTLTASGATTYTWSPNTNLSATTGASVNANPASTITYSVTGTTASCPSVPATVVVTVNTTPTVSLSAPPTICSGNSTTLTASGATTYTWSPNTNLSATTGASVSASPNSTITYSVTGTTTGCPSLPATVVVTVNATPTVTLSAPPTICSGNSTTLTASGATTYTWSPNTNLSATTGASVNANPASTITYSVTGTTASCPSVPATVVVTVNTTPTVSLSAPPTICSGNSTTLTASGATTYTWSPNTNLSATTGASVNASPNSTITYSVTGTTTGCPSSPATVVVTVNTTPTVTLSAPPTICPGNSTTLTASGATTYSWSPNTNLSATTGASVSANPSSTITYTVTGTTGSCTSSPQTIVVTVTPTPTVTLSAPPTICSGNSTTLTASGATTYTWSPNTNLSATTGASVNANPTATITYTVIGTTGCPSAPTTVVVTVNTTPTVSLSAPPTICSGNSTTLTASGATTYSWSPNTNLSATTGASVNANPASTITYSVTGTTTGCPSAPATVAVTVNTTPTVTLSAPPTICSGNSTTLTASGATTYTWSPNTNLSVTTGASVNANPSSTITYSVTGTTTGCPSAPATVVVTVNTTPIVSLSAPPTICSGNSTTLTAIGATTYTWSPNTNLSATTGASVNANPNSTITYSVTGTTTGCPSSPATVVVTVNTTPTVSLSAPPTICPGNSTTLTASGATTYSWSPNTNLSATTGASVNASPTTTITYTVIGTTTGCPSAPQTIVVTVTSAPTVTLSSPPTICSGSTTTLTASGATTYTWSPNTNLSATTGSSVIASPTSTITYTVVGTTGCPGTPVTIVVTVNPIPATPTAGSNSPICLGGAINLTASVVGGATYSWTGPNSFSSSSQNPSIASAVLPDGGTYSVTATVSGCTSPAGTTVVIVNPPPPAPTVGSNSPVCTGNKLNLTASAIASATYSWAGPNSFSSSSQNPSILGVTAAAAGTYSVNATVPGCATGPDGTVTVVVNTTPTVTLSAPPTICSGSSTTLTASGATTYTWSPNTDLSATTGASVNSNPVSTITYTVTGTTTGCPSAPAKVVVTVNPIPATPTAGSNSPICLGGAINLTASAVGGAVYSWTGPNSFTSSSQNPSIASSVLADSGTYSVTATVGGCAGPAGITYVIVNPPPAAPTAGSNSPICAGSTLTLTANTISSAVYSWTGPSSFSSSSQNPSIIAATVSATGTYSVTATVPGCVTSPVGTVAVVVNPIPAAPTAGSNGPLCSGSTLNLTASAIATATYSWTGPNSFTASIQNPSLAGVTTADAGTYSVTATANSCTGPAGTVTVAINDPAIVVAGPPQTVCANNDSVKLNGTSSTGSAQWSSSGTGSFKPTNTTLNAVYIPSNADTAAGSITLTLTSKNNGACSPVTDNLVVTITDAPKANAGPNQTVCGNNDVVILNGSFNSAASGAVWSTSGTGVFSPNNTTMNATYTPSSADTAAGSVIITLTTTGNGQCKAVSSSMTVTITNAPNVYPGSNVSLCKNNANVSLNGVTSTGSGTWSTSGAGTFTPNNTTLNATYIPSSADTAAGSVTLTLTSGANGTCTPVSQSITATFTPIPKVTTGPNVAVCANNDSIKLSGTSTTGAGQWATSGTGTFSPNNTTLNATYVPSNADTAAGTVTLTLSSTNNATCLGVSKGMTVTFTHAPTDNAGSDASACSNNANVTLNGSFTIASGAIWSTSGTGVFSPNNTTMNAVYVPSTADTTANGVTLVLTTTGNGSCKAVTDTMKIAYTTSPNVEAGNNTKVCLSSPNYTLSGYSSTTKGIWSTLGTGAFLPSNTTLGATYVPSTADTAAHTVTLILTSTNNGGCNPVSDTIVLTYTKIPSVTAGSNQTVCANNDNVSLNGTSTTGTGIWTSTGSGIFTPNNTTLNATYVPSNADTAAGSVKLTFTATGGCSPVAKSIIITITHAPFVEAGPDQAVCRNNANVTLNGYVGGGTTTGQWSTSGSGVFTPGNTTLNAVYVPSTADTTAGKVNIVLTSTGNGSCNAVTDTMVITYTKIPVVNAGPDATVCANNDSVKLAGSSTTGTGQWSTSGTGAFVPNNSTLNATYVPSNADTGVGSVTLTLTSTTNGGCIPVTDQMVITINHAPTANAGPDQSVCANNANVNLAGIVTTASGGQWSTSGTGTFSPNSTTLNATYIPSAADTTAHKVTLVLVTTGNGLCKTVTDTMIVTITPAPKVEAGNNALVCVTSPNVVLNGTSSTGSGQWSTLGDGSFTPNNTTLNATYIPGNNDTVSGSVKLILTSSANVNCNAVTDTMMIKYAKPPKDNAGSNTTVCANKDTVSLSGFSTTGSGIWNTSGSGSFSPNNTALNGKYIPGNADTTAGTVNLTLTSTNNGGCSAAANSLTVTITPAPTVNAGPDQTVCANAIVTLSGSVNSVASGGQWSTSGSGTFTPNNTTLNAIYTPSTADTTAHTVTLVLTTTGNGLCKAATDTMIVTINPGPRVNAGPDAGVCLSSPDYTLSGYSSTGSGTWTTSGSGSFSPNANTLNATYIPSTADTSAKTVTLVLTSANNGSCSVSTDTIVLIYTTTPSVNAGGNQTVCANNATVTLSGSSGTGSGVWSTSGTGTFSPNNTTLNGTYIPSSADTTAGTVTLTLTTSGGCSPVSNSMVVTITPAPFANAGADQFACKNNPDVTLNGYVGGGASTGVWSTSGTGSFVPNNTTLNATYVAGSADTAAGKATLVLTTTNNGTCLATTDTMVIHYTAPPVVNAGPDANSCANNFVTLNGTITGGSGTGVWSTTNGTGTFSPNNTTLNASYLPSNGDTLVKNIVLVLTSTNNGTCLAITDTMIVTVNPGPIVGAGADQTVCANNPNITLSGSIVHATGGLWTTLGSGSFSPNNTALNATYVPGASDITAGSVKLVLSSTGNGLCTTATDTMVVTFSPAPIVNAGNNIFICTGSTTASLNGTITGGAATGKWTTLGSGTFTPNDSALNATYNLSTSDTTAHKVTLVLTSTHNGTCFAVTDTVIIKVTPVPNAFAGSDTTVCATTDSIPLHGIVTGGSGTGVWKTLGSGKFTPNDSILGAYYKPSAADTSAHTVKLVLTTTNACMPVTDTMMINFNPAPVINAGVNQTICANNPDVMLSGSVMHASGGKWTTLGSGTFVPNDSALNATYIPSAADVTADSVKLVLSSTGNGLCTTATDTMMVKFSPSPKVNAGSNIFICTGSTTAILNGSVTGGATTGKWITLGSGTFTPNDSALNATYNLSAADTTAHKVTLVLRSTNNASCLAVTDTVIIKITPVSTAFAGADTTVCASAGSVPIHGIITGGSGTGKWTSLGSGTFTPNDSTLSAAYMPSTADTSAHSVKLILTSTNTCMPSSDTMVINFNPLPIAHAGVDQTICGGSTVSLNGAVSHAIGGIWTTSGTGTFAPNDSAMNATYVPGSSDVSNGAVTLILTTKGNNSCSASADSLKVIIQSKPVANFASSTACLGSTVNFTDASTVKVGAITAWHWTFGGGNSTVQNPTSTFNSTGLQPVTLAVATSAGCSDTVTRSIYVNPLPVSLFNFTTYCQDSAQFADVSTITAGSIKTWLWKFGDSASSMLENPSHTYAATGGYWVALVVTSDSGCSASQKDSLNVEPCNNQNGVTTPAVPSAFTPNGDGNNDILYVRGGPFSMFDFRVFNEWGNEIFHSVVQSSGWDGKIHGAPQPEGSYVWTLTGTTVDGKSVKMTGDVTLLR